MKVLVPLVSVWALVGCARAEWEGVDRIGALDGVRAALVAMESKSVDLEQPHFLTVTNSTRLVMLEAIPIVPGATGEEKLVVRMRATSHGWEEVFFQDSRTNGKHNPPRAKNAEDLVHLIKICLEKVRELNPKTNFEDFSISYGKGANSNTWIVGVDLKPYSLHGGYLLTVNEKGEVAARS